MAKRAVQVADLLAVKTISDVQLSPDGQRIAYVQSEIDVEQDENHTSVWVVPAGGGEPVRYSRGPKRDSAPRWSPDGRALAFLSDRDSKDPQLYVMPASGGEARRITTLEKGAGPAVWSPDGTRIAFAARILTEPAPKDEAARKRWEQRPKVVTRAQYKADGQGYVFDTRTHLFVVPVDPSGNEAGEAKQITEGDASHLSPAWSPDGTRLAYTRETTAAADYNMFDVWVAGADGSDPRQVSHHAGRATAPAWSPDGRTIACFGNDSREPGLGDPMWRVWLLSPDGSEERNLTRDYDRSAVPAAPPAPTPPPYWSADGATLTYIASERGSNHVVRVAVGDGRVETVVSGERQVTSASFAAGRIAFSATTPDSPPDVFLCDAQGREERRLTLVNQALLDQLDFPRIERRRFSTPNGGVDGWLCRPPGERSVPTPLLVHIHGGPHSYSGNGYVPSAFYQYVLAGQGWATLSLNPTGSGSYGRAFAHDIRGRWGEHDLAEQLAAVDVLIAEGVADGARLAVAGYSYGGYMTSWTIGHTDRFKAAVVGAPVTNLESFHGTSDIGIWFGSWEMKGDLARNRETFRRLSPINYVERVTTPTLIIHGEADDRCPIEQGEQFYAGLVAAGHVPAELVRYPGGSHSFISNGRPSHRVDATRRVVEWVQRYAGGAS